MAENPQVAVRLDARMRERLAALREAHAAPGLELTLSDAARMALAAGLDALEAARPVAVREGVPVGAALARVLVRGAQAEHAQAAAAERRARIEPEQDTDKPRKPAPSAKGKKRGKR